MKTLTVLEKLWVHYAPTPDNAAAEVAMLQRFADTLSPASRMGLYDPDDPAPFANLRTGHGSIKQHGIRGATGELGRSGSIDTRPSPTLTRPHPTASTPAEPPLVSRPVTGAGNAASQPVTAKDIVAGQVRFPRAAKRLLPPDRTYVAVTCRGQDFDHVRWDPRIGPDKERSGLLGSGKGKLDGLVDAGEILTLTSYPDGRLELT